MSIRNKWQEVQSNTRTNGKESARIYARTRREKYIHDVGNNPRIIQKKWISEWRRNTNTDWTI